MASKKLKRDSLAPTTDSGATRRGFIKTASGLAVAGAAATPSLSWARPHVAGSDSVKIGLVGCGGRGTGAAIQAMNTNSGEVRLTAMGDAFTDRLNGCLETCTNAHKEKVQVPEEQRFVGYDAYQKVLETDIDLVILATPPGFRPQHFEAAVNAGKHVFMEKPVACDAPGVRRVLAANEIAKDRSLLVQVGLQRRHERLYREIIGRLQDGAIGDINFMRAYWNGGGVWVNPRNEAWTELEYQMRNWYYFNWICGDHIVEQHIHNLDVINWLKDAYPVVARGMGGREVRKGKDFGQIFDHFSVEFEYADGSTMLSQCRHIRKAWSSVSEHAHGSKGVANISGGVIKPFDGMEFRSDKGRGGHQQEHHDLFKDLLDGRVPNEGDYGAKSTMTAILGRMATYSGKQVSWDQGINSELVLCEVDGLTDLDSPAPVQPDENGDYPIPVPGQSWDTVL